MSPATTACDSGHYVTVVDNDKLTVIQMLALSGMCSASQPFLERPVSSITTVVVVCSCCLLNTAGHGVTRMERRLCAFSVLRH